VRPLRTALHVLTGAYAVDAIDDQSELGRFERHLRHCQQCASEVRGMTETATRLGFAASQPAPPALRDRVLTSVARTGQLPPAAARHRSRAAPRPGRMLRLGWVAAAVSLVVIIGLTTALLQTQGRLDRARSQRAALAAVLAAPDARAITRATSAGGTATVVYSLRKHSLIVTLARLPSPPAGKVYELWLLGPPRVRPAGLLPAAARGRSAPVLVDGLVSGDQLGLTVEPAGGTSRPTTTPILVLPLRA
jgi:hypothetical protein